MSWLKLNDSLNAIKGQITNFAQDVLAESEELENSEADVNDAGVVKINELTELCSTQDNEVIKFKEKKVRLC